MKRLFSSLLPSVLVVIAAMFVATHFNTLPAGQFALARFVPLVIAAVGLALSFHFNRSRIFFQLVVVAVAYITVAWEPPRIGATTVYAATALLVPANLVLFSALKERGILTPVGFGRFAIVLVQAAGLAAFAVTDPIRLQDWLYFGFIREALVAWTALPQPALLALGLAIAGGGARLLWRPDPQVGGLLGALVASALMFQFADDAGAVMAYGAAAALVLAVSVIQESYSMAYIDELTALPGRRALQEALLKLGNRYTIAMLDVDRFKKFNDTYGHDVGDQVLRMVGSRLKGVGGGGKPFRYGGEEFSIVFPGKKVDEVLEELEEVRRRIATSGFALRSRDRRRAGEGRRGTKRPDKRVTVTISIGVAGRKGAKDKVEPSQVIKAADKALYRAKNNGRNQVSR